MKEVWDCLFSHYGLAYATGVGIFLITLFLAAKRLIGFAITSLLLIFAILASLVVANSDTIKGYFSKSSPGTTSAYQAAPAQPSTAPNAPSNSSTGSQIDRILNQLQKTYDDLKTFLESEKERFDQYIEKKGTDQNTHPTPTPTPEQGSSKDGS